MSPRHSFRASVIAARFKTDFDNGNSLAKEISARLVQINALFEQQNRPLFELHQINRGMFSALICLRLSGAPYELRHRDLLDQMLLTSGGITNLCQSLKKLNLIESLPDPDDGRGVIFRLTESGLLLTDEIVPQQHHIEQQLVMGLTDEETQLLRSLLEKMTCQYDL